MKFPFRPNRLVAFTIKSRKRIRKTRKLVKLRQQADIEDIDQRFGIKRKTDIRLLPENPDLKKHKTKTCRRVIELKNLLGRAE